MIFQRGFSPCLILSSLLHNLRKWGRISKMPRMLPIQIVSLAVFVFITFLEKWQNIYWVIMRNRMKREKRKKQKLLLFLQCILLWLQRTYLHKKSGSNKKIVWKSQREPWTFIQDFSLSYILRFLFSFAHVPVAKQFFKLHQQQVRRAHASKRISGKEISYNTFDATTNRWE